MPLKCRNTLNQYRRLHIILLKLSQLKSSETHNNFIMRQLLIFFKIITGIHLNDRVVLGIYCESRGWTAHDVSAK